MSGGFLETSQETSTPQYDPEYYHLLLEKASADAEFIIGAARSLYSLSVTPFAGYQDKGVLERHTDGEGAIATYIPYTVGDVETTSTDADDNSNTEQEAHEEQKGNPRFDTSLHKETTVPKKSGPQYAKKTEGISSTAIMPYVEPDRAVLGRTREDTSQDTNQTASVEFEGRVRTDFDSAVIAYAKAKLDREKILAGRQARVNLEWAGRSLRQAFEAVVDAMPDNLWGVDQNLQSALEENNIALQTAKDSLRSYRKQRVVGGETSNAATEAERLKLDITRIEIRLQDIRSQIAARPATRPALIANELATLVERVDNAYLAERKRRHPKFHKVMTFLQKHPKIVLGTSLAATGVGFVGAMTFNAPLIAFGNTLKTIARGVGSYEATMSIGEMRASKHMKEITDMPVGKHVKVSVDSYLEASRRQSDTRRNSKRVGLAVGSLLTLGPMGWGIADTINKVVHVKPPSTHIVPKPKPPAHIAPKPVAKKPPAVKPLNIQPVDSNTLPWTFGMDNLHTNISNPQVLNTLVHNHDGIKFVGNGLGGGRGQILSVIIRGRKFSDLGHINGAIEYILQGTS